MLDAILVVALCFAIGIVMKEISGHPWPWERHDD